MEENQSESSMSVPEERKTDLDPSISKSESKESQIEHIISDMERQPSLLSVHEAIEEENERDHSPRNETDAVKGGDEETKTILRSNDSTLKSASSQGKEVRFAEEVTEYDDDASQTTPPFLTGWEEDEGGSVEGPIVNSISRRAGEAYGHFHQSNPPLSLCAKLNRYLSWSRIGSCIVRAAPCFWCARKKFSVSATDRQILLRLNLLCAFFCVLQVMIGVFIFITKFTGYVEKDNNEVSNPDVDKPPISVDLWSLETFVYFISLINFVLLIATVLAHRAIRNVNLVGSVRFMWVLFWLLPLQIFCMIGLFDINNVGGVTAKYWWDDPSMSFVRRLFCEEGTEDSKCMAPIDGGSVYESELIWCQKEYNATDCESVRDDAQRRYNLSAGIYYTVNGVWALLLVVLMWVTLSLLQAVITLPIVQRSKESNIPLWLTFPIVGCFALGYILLFEEASIEEIVDDVYWIAIGYLTSGGLFTLAAMIGIVLKFYTVLNRRQRRIKQGLVIVFISTIMMTLLAVSTIFVTSLLYSFRFVDLTEDSLQQIACVIDMSGSCTGCDQLPKQCPEWTNEDVQKVLATMMKQNTTLAAIFLVYAMITLRYGFVLFAHVSRYQIEYV